MNNLIKVKEQIKHSNGVELVIYEDYEFDMFHDDREIPKENINVRLITRNLKRIEYEYMGFVGCFNLYLKGNHELRFTTGI